MNVRLDECTWPEVEDLLTREPTIVVPVGSTEQHGHHLPLQVDATLCTEVATRAARRTSAAGHPTLVAPTVNVGYSPHHMDFPGSLTLSASTFSAVLTDIAISLARHGFKRILLLNGHGGNANILRSTVQSLRFEHDVDVAGASYWDFALEAIGAWRRSALGGINHACEMETSLMLALRTDMVRQDLIRDVIPDSDPYGSRDLTNAGPVMRARSFSEVTPTGAIGAPSLADADRGDALLEAIVEAVASYLLHGTRSEPASAAGQEEA